MFKGFDPNGFWQLFISDDNGLDTGALIGGWALEITAEVDLPAAAAAASGKSKTPRGNKRTRARSNGKQSPKNHRQAQHTRGRHRRQR